MDEIPQSGMIYLSEKEERLIHVFQRAQFFLASVLSVLALYCLIKKTPRQQAKIRNFLLFTQVTVIINGFYMDVLFEPIPLFPAFGGYCTGLLCQADVPVPTVLAGMILTFVWFGLSLFYCCFYRHQSLMPEHRKLNRRLVHTLNGIAFALASLPLVACAITPIDERESAALLNSSKYNLNWVPARGKCFIHELSQKVYAFLIPLLVALSGCILIIVSLFFHMLYVLGNDKSRSTKTIKNIRQSLGVLFIQIFIPLVFLAVPGLIELCSLMCDCISFRVTLSFFCLSILHTLLHNAILLGSTSTYRSVLLRFPRQFMGKETSMERKTTISSVRRKEIFQLT